MSAIHNPIFDLFLEVVADSLELAELCFVFVVPLTRLNEVGDYQQEQDSNFKSCCTDYFIEV